LASVPTFLEPPTVKPLKIGVFKELVRIITTYLELPEMQDLVKRLWARRLHQDGEQAFTSLSLADATFSSYRSATVVTTCTRLSTPRSRLVYHRRSHGFAEHTSGGRVSCSLFQVKMRTNIPLAPSLFCSQLPLRFPLLAETMSCAHILIGRPSWWTWRRSLSRRLTANATLRPCSGH
jgi:hypothetical protein